MNDAVEVESERAIVSDTKTRHLVILESPYRGDGRPETIERNVRYARACVRDALLRGECPIASHLLYTQPGVLRDEVPEERTLGVEAGLAWGSVADATVVYTDLGISSGMAFGCSRARQDGRPVIHRTLGVGWDLP